MVTGERAADAREIEEDGKCYLVSLTEKIPNSKPGLWLGTGLNGGETDNANDETLGLAVQWPELEALTLWKGKFSNEAFAKLATLPNLRYLQVYGSQIDPQAFAVLARLKSLEAIQFGEYAVTDELLGFLGKSPTLMQVEIPATSASRAMSRQMAMFSWLSTRQGATENCIMGISAEHCAERTISSWSRGLSGLS